MRAIPINLALFAVVSFAPTANAQVPVDDSGNPIGSSVGVAEDVRYASDAARLSNRELEELVDRVALYPDDLLAIVLPAASYPLQVVEASRFLDALEDDPLREPDPDWDDSIVALINYPEIVELMNEDLEWTYALGEAFVTQQEDLLSAVDSFRDRAYAAGNLRSDEYQEVRESDNGIIEIEPVDDDIIYVPYYEPERVVVYQSRPVYHYYSRPYPVYYYPYADSWVHTGYFFGLTSAFQIGWSSHSLHVLHHSHRYHPYYGRYYHSNWWYRRPSIHIHNSIYVGDYGRRHYRYGDYWRPRHERRLHLDDQRVTRSRYYGDRQRETIRARQDDRRAGSSSYGVERDGARRQASRETRPVTRNSDRRLPVERNATVNRNGNGSRVTRDDDRERTPRIASASTRNERTSVERRQSGSDQLRATPTERRQSIMNPDRRVREQRQSIPQRPTQQPRSIQTRPSAQVRAPQSRPTQARPEAYRPTQSRPVQSRPVQSRPTQSRPTQQSRPVQSQPTQARPARPLTTNSMQGRRTESRPTPSRNSNSSNAQRSRSTRPAPSVQRRRD